MAKKTASDLIKSCDYFDMLHPYFSENPINTFATLEERNEISTTYEERTDSRLSLTRQHQPITIRDANLRSSELQTLWRRSQYRVKLKAAKAANDLLIAEHQQHLQQQERRVPKRNFIKNFCKRKSDSSSTSKTHSSEFSSENCSFLSRKNSSSQSKSKQSSRTSSSKDSIIHSSLPIFEILPVLRSSRKYGHQLLYLLDGLNYAYCSECKAKTKLKLDHIKLSNCCKL